MAVIVDIDDTLLRYGNRPIRRTIEYVNSLDEEIIIITGRYSTRKNETVRALRSAGLKFSRIFMRPVGDGESNSIPFKKKKAAELKSRISISMAIDNDANARAAYRSLGIKSINPASLPVIQ